MQTTSQHLGTHLNGALANLNPNNLEQKQTEQRQQLCEQPTPGALRLRHDPAGRQKLAGRLYRDFHAMKTYGKEPESLESIISLFNETMAGYEINEVLEAMGEHARRSAEFPAPAEIIVIMDAERARRRRLAEYGGDAQRSEIELLRSYREKGIPLTHEQQAKIESAN